MTDAADPILRPRNIGARVKRVEDRRLLTGEGAFTDDRATLNAVLGYVKFPYKDVSHATTYASKKGRIVAWQFTWMRRSSPDGMRITA